MPNRPRPACPSCGRLSGCTCAKAQRQVRERARGTATQRGYGSRHQLERRRWLPEVANGLVACARCGRPIRTGQAWDLGHTDDRRAWTGPEHAACNRAAAARKRNRMVWTDVWGRGRRGRPQRVTGPRGRGPASAQYPFGNGPIPRSLALLCADEFRPFCRTAEPGMSAPRTRQWLQPSNAPEKLPRPQGRRSRPVSCRRVTGARGSVTPAGGRSRLAMES